jgi:hypothetical protein
LAALPGQLLVEYWEVVVEPQLVRLSAALLVQSLLLKVSRGREGIATITKPVTSSALMAHGSWLRHGIVRHHLLRLSPLLRHLDRTSVGTK